MFIGCSTIMTSIGASGEVITSSDDEPMCMHTIIPLSDARPPHRVPVVGVEARPARAWTGFSEKVIAWQPFLATRRTSAAITSGSQIAGMASRG